MALIPISEIYAGLEPENSIHGRKVHRLNAAVHYLDRPKPTLETIGSLFRKYTSRAGRSKTPQARAEYELLSGHLSWLGSLNDDPNLKDEYAKFKTASNPEGYLGDQGIDATHEDTLTFRLDLHIHRIRASLGPSTFQRDMFDACGKEVFLPRISRVIENVWRKHSILVSPNSLDASAMLRKSFVEFMHMQLAQNALTHAHADATFNGNYTKFYREHFSNEGEDFLFGVLTFLDVTLLDPKAMGDSNFNQQLQSFYPKLKNLMLGTYERLIRQKRRLLIFSYCDTGPGIERHVRNFSPSRANLSDTLSLKQIMDGRIAGRESAGAGQGLNDVRELASEISAKIVVETPDGTYFSDNHNGVEETDRTSRLSRGTTFSVILEI
ncbi:MAG: hypothetical protein Q7J44_21985 [Pseudotabrizicola sp.]|uniref:hypothetical protein n=1 Tax=Pseudotabrizicola sp. TaxID=2939647 RepID=UPI0027269FBC|nr:hypothetical protein [Pseudotabrizicola sp.]MDO9641207.1 hypothetical protein [Pseudotabrizicola sp.]